MLPLHVPASVSYTQQMCIRDSPSTQRTYQTLGDLYLISDLDTEQECKEFVRELDLELSLIHILFVLAPCESCHEEEKFRQEIADRFAKAGIENQDYTVYNVYKESGASHFEKTVGKYRCV